MTDTASAPPGTHWAAPEGALDDRSAALIGEGLSFAGRSAGGPADGALPVPADLRARPALFWLVHLLRPATLAGLQLRRAGAQFALCQAILELGLDARAWGFGSWSGEEDPAARAGLPASALPPALRARNARDFPQISRLARLGGAGAALDRFEPGMFDLILIDAAAEIAAETATGAADLAGRLAAATSPRGVVAVQGLDEDGAGGLAARALAGALAERHPVLALGGNGGLMLALTGARPLPALAALARPGAEAGWAALQARLADLADLAAPGAPEAQDAPQETPAEEAAPELAPEPALELAPEPALEPDAEPAAGTAAEPQAPALPAPAPETEPAPEFMADPAPLADPGAAPRIAALEADLAAARTRLAEGHALRLRETRVLTAELERLTETLREEKAGADAALRTAADEAAATEAARAACAAELAALRIRQFDEAEALRGEIDWLERAAAGERAEAEARLAAETERLTARHAAETADLAAAMAAELATERRLAAERIAAAKKTATRLQQEVNRLRAEAADRERLRQVQLKLRDWQLAWVTGKPRFGKRAGPSGGVFAEELAAVAQSPLFDAGWYGSAYPDLQDSPLPPAEHFLRHGLFEGRNPGPDFRTLAWFADNPEALDTHRNPLLDPPPG